MFLLLILLWFSTNILVGVFFLLSGQRGRCRAERISIISQEERECLLSDSAAESVNTKWRSEAEIDKCLALFWHWASGTGQALLRTSEAQHYSQRAFLANESKDTREEATWRLTNVCLCFDTGPQALAGHFSPDVLTNDLGTLATCRFNEWFWWYRR